MVSFWLGAVAQIISWGSCVGVGQAAQEEKAVPNQALSRQAEGWLSAFHIKRGFRLEIAASEALVSAPVAMTFDENGRLFVAEMRDYPNKQGQAPHLGRIRLLEDTDGDGFFDASTVYADNLAWPSAIACYNGGLFVASTPDILFLKDMNGDGVADTRKIVFSGFGDANTASFENLIGSFQWGLDNRIHGLAAGLEGAIMAGAGAGADLLVLHREDFCFDPRSLSIMPEAGLGRSGLAFDVYGRRFVSDYRKPLQMAMLETRYAQRNPFFVIPEQFAPVVTPGATVYPFDPQTAPTPPAARQGIASRATGQSPPRAWMTQARGSVIYRGSAFPAGYVNTAFIADGEKHLIHHVILRDNGLEVAATRAADEPDSEFLSSSDPAFHPTQIVNGPEGVLYVADLQNGGDTGRILRIAPENFKQPRLPQLGKAKIYDLVAALAQGNGWHQETAARLMYERHDPGCVALLTNMILNSRVPLARMRALHALEGQGAVTEPVLLRCLRDNDEHVREHAVLVSETLARNGPISDELWNQLKSLIGDPSVHVAYQLALSAGEIRRPEKARLLRDLLGKQFANRWFEPAVFSSVGDGMADLFLVLANDPDWRLDPGGQGFFLQLATMIGTTGRMDDVTRLLNFFNQANFDVVQVNLMLHALGEGLLRTGSSLALVDPQFRLRRFYDQTEDAILDQTAADALRVSALRLRSVSPYTITGSGDFLQLLFGTQQSYAVQAAAVATLGRYENRNIPENIFARWQELSPALRTAVIAAFLGRMDRVPLVLDALENGRIRNQDFSITQVNLLRTFSDPNISQRAVQLFGPFLAQRPVAVDSVRDSLRLAGTASRGRPTFVARCGACHGKGPGPHPPGYCLEVTPDQRGRLFRKIVEPNAILPPEAAARVVLSKTGEVWVGRIRNVSKQSVTLEQSNGGEIVLPQVNIANIYPQPWSIMPEGLESGLSAQDLADLMDYVIYE